MSVTEDAVRSETESGFVVNLQHRLMRQFKVQVADWQDTCRELANWEDRHLVESQSPERLAEHLSILQELERVGRWLAAAANQPGFGDADTAEQIRLSIQDLLDTRAMWHGQVSEARKREILRDCFNEP
jgi:hypothetical protein